MPDNIKDKVVTLEDLKAAQIIAPALPTVTSSDAGKFLCVDSNGEWVKGDIPGDAFIITGTLSSMSGGTYQESFADILSAYHNGTPVYLKFSAQTASFRYNFALRVFMSQYKISTSAYDVVTTEVINLDGVLSNIQIRDDGTFVLNQLGKALPSVTSSDAGKILRVDSNGEWVAETITNAEGSGF